MPEGSSYYVYIMASKPYGTLYIGVTNSLYHRVLKHREPSNKGFTGRYKVHTLVWFEVFEDISIDIHREKIMKKWPRDWKINLIERENQSWADLHRLTGGQ
jgi:putative endonuclease